MRWHGKKRLKCSGALPRELAASHRHMLATSLMSSLKPGITRLVTSSQTPASRIMQSVRSTGSSAARLTRRYTASENDFRSTLAASISGSSPASGSLHT